MVIGGCVGGDGGDGGGQRRILPLCAHNFALLYGAHDKSVEVTSPNPIEVVAAIVAAASALSKTNCNANSATTTVSCATNCKFIK